MTTTMNGRGRPRRWATTWVLTAAAALMLSLVGSWTTPVRADTPAASRAGHVLFADYFTTSPDRAWTFFNRAGEVTGGSLVIDGDYLPGPRPSRDGWAMTHVGDKAWRDYTFTVTYDSRNVAGSPPEAHMAVLYARVVSSGAHGAGTYYAVYVSDPGMPDPSGETDGVLVNGLTQLIRVDHGVYTELKHVYVSNTVTGSNQARISLNGARITVTVNGQRIFSVVDPHPICHGGVGVGAIWETNGSFDNVMVRQIVG